jgi:hypothetical protein
VERRKDVSDGGLNCFKLLQLDLGLQLGVTVVSVLRYSDCYYIFSVVYDLLQRLFLELH